MIRIWKDRLFLFGIIAAWFLASSYTVMALSDLQGLGLPEMNAPAVTIITR